MIDLARLTAALDLHLPSVLRWAGAVARRMRMYNIALEGKQSGSANTDALTLADLTVQELVVGALRDCDPLFRKCRIEAEETTGDLDRFATDAPYTIALDPIDGTKQYRDKTGNGWCQILTVRSEPTVHYSLVYLPEQGTEGYWVRACAGTVTSGPDDLSRPADQVVAALPRRSPAAPAADGGPKSIYLIGFQQRERERAALVSAAGLNGVPADDAPSAIYHLLAEGQFAGSLIHSPNIYDFPASLQIARALGGDSVWTDTGESVHFRELWMDERAGMLRLPRIVATSPDRAVLKTLCDVAQGWSPFRYDS
jgi:3'(2'), 5'-bisphosphate nucleotidase